MSKLSDTAPLAAYGRLHLQFLHTLVSCGIWYFVCYAFTKAALHPDCLHASLSWGSKPAPPPRSLYYLQSHPVIPGFQSCCLCKAAHSVPAVSDLSEYCSKCAGGCRCADRLRLKPWLCQRGWDLLGCRSHWRPGLFSTRVVSGDRMCVRTCFLVLLQSGKEGVVCLKQCGVLLTTVNTILELVNWWQSYANQSLRERRSKLYFNIFFIKLRVILFLFIGGCLFEGF